MRIFRQSIVSHNFGASGFSLVEVTLAIGITAVALVSLMGMIPRGMKTLQKAADQAVMGRIHQQILGELQLTPWESESGQAPLDSFDGAVRFYDDQGIELAQSDKGGIDHIYTAKISLPRIGSKLPNSVGGGTHQGVVTPGASKGGVRIETVRLAIVEITSNVDPNFLQNPGSGFDGLNYANAVSVYRTMVARMGQEYSNK